MKRTFLFRSVVAVILLHAIALPSSEAKFNDRVKEVTEENKKVLRILEADIQKWAPLHDGALANNRDGDQGDIIERSGFMCMFGFKERCEDVKRSQESNGRFRRSPNRVGNEEEIDAFSRDHFNGVMAYYIGTRDINSALKFKAYLDSTKGMLCPRDKVSDNRCTMYPESWAMFGEVFRYLGLKETLKMKFDRLYDDPIYSIEALFSRKGFEAVLPSWTVILRRMMKANSPNVERSAQIAAHRQPLNAFVQYAAYGASNEMAQLIIEACPHQDHLNPYMDYTWNRALVRDAASHKISIERNGKNVPVTQSTDGWDCLQTIAFFFHEVTG